MTALSGFLLATEATVEVPRDLIETRHPLVSNGPTLRYKGYSFNLTRWDEYELLSPIPLGEEQLDRQPPYKYQVFIVRGHGKIIVLAERKRISEYVIAAILDKRIFPNFRKVSIYIDKMIEFCQAQDSEFLVTSLVGRFSGPSRSIRTISLYGDDVTDSPVFRDHFHLFNFFSCGLGRRLYDGIPRLKPNEDGEIVRLGNDGGVTLNQTSRIRASEFIRVLSFVLRNRWVEAWVPIGGDDLR